MYIVKQADTTWEFEQIHRLNYQTFTQELGQHLDTGVGSIVDKFHAKNVYFVVLRDARVVGMVAVHDEPPFSIADRLADPGILDRLGRRLLEVRLLAVVPDERHGVVFLKLIRTVHQYARTHSYAQLLISGLRERERLYERLGFRALGRAVRSGRVSFVPMALAMDAVSERGRRIVARSCFPAIGEPSELSADMYSAR